MALSAVRDLRDVRPPATAEELEQFETDVLAGFVLARASAGLADGTIRGAKDAALRIPPSGPEVKTLFAGWGGEPATCRKFAPTARNHTASKLMSQVGLRVSEACKLDLADIKWDLGRFGKLHVRHGKGARGSGPRERMVPLANGADRTLRWFIEDVRGQFDDDHTRPGAPLFPSERRCADGSSGRVGDDALRGGLKAAAMAHLPTWGDKLTPHVLRHFCAFELYLGGLDLIAIQEVLGHSWIATTMRCVSSDFRTRTLRRHLDATVAAALQAQNGGRA
ncbi:site-specific integrase [Streptomyces sp. NPDC006435]|uniref:tyrosine-type recombinase/integrase n=1 Tax=Streptomyces sp. NPDC006435 TaxID=3154300 RepID=UPI0033B799DE